MLGYSSTERAEAAVAGMYDENKAGRGLTTTSGGAALGPYKQFTGGCLLRGSI